MGAARSALVVARVRRGWSVDDLVGELRRRALALGVTLPSDKVMRRYVTGWESGKSAPTDGFCELLCEIYRESEVELGIGVEQPRPAGPARRTSAGNWLRLVTGGVAA